MLSVHINVCKVPLADSNPSAAPLIAEASSRDLLDTPEGGGKRRGEIMGEPLSWSPTSLQLYPV